MQKRRRHLRSLHQFNDLLGLVDNLLRINTTPNRSALRVAWVT
jgi:hypothetical protein